MSGLNKKLVIFDLNGTITNNKLAIEPEMAELICKILLEKKVAIISGGGYSQFLNQFVSKLPVSQQGFSNLYLLPTSGTRLYNWKGGWHEDYAEDLTEKEKEKISTVLKSVMNSPAYEKPSVIYGDVIEDRGSQITFSALGQKAPINIKYAWDPSRKKREYLVTLITKKIPEFDVRVGGATSIDVTRKGVNKGYGIMKLSQYLKIPVDDMIFVGDALFFGGNDYPAKSTGVDCISVNGPAETAKLIKSWIK